MTLLSCWGLITLLNFDTCLSRNSADRRYVDGSEFHVELRPRVKIPRYILTPGMNSTLNFDPNPRSQFNLGSQFNVESRPGVTIQRGIMTPVHNLTWNLDPGHNSTWNLDPGFQFDIDLWPGVTNSTWNYDPGSKFYVELENWHSQRGPRWGHVTMTLSFDLLTPKSIGVFLSLSSICVWSMKSLGQTLFELPRYNEVWTDGRTYKVITIGLPHPRWRGPNYYSVHSSTLNRDPNPGSQLNVNPWFGVTFQRGIKTWGHNSTWNKDPGSQFNGGSKFYPSEGS